MPDSEDDEEARRRRAEELRQAIDEAAEGEHPPSSPREFTDREAHEAAEGTERRRRADDEEGN
jgi:hypothetical protein